MTYVICIVVNVITNPVARAIVIAVKKYFYSTYSPYSLGLPRAMRVTLASKMVVPR